MLKKILALLLLSASLFANQGKVVQANGIDIWYETFGDKENPPLLLIMGACCQGMIWPKALCERLADEGFYIIRYDHRDMGSSSCFDLEKQPYDLMDMAKDAVGLLDALGIQKAHLFGLSMGGWISQIIAAHFPERVHSLMVMGSSCEIRPMNLAYADAPAEDKWPFSAPTQQYQEWLKEFLKLAPETEEDKLAQRMAGWDKLNGAAFPLNEENNRQMQKEYLARLRHPQGIVNHILMMRSESAEEQVRSAPAQIRMPMIILQGTEDPIFQPDHGEALHRLVPGSEYHLVEGMGHVPNEQFFDLYVDLLKRQASIKSE